LTILIKIETKTENILSKCTKILSRLKHVLPSSYDFTIYIYTDILTRYIIHSNMSLTGSTTNDITRL